MSGTSGTELDAAAAAAVAAGSAHQGGTLNGGGTQTGAGQQGGKDRNNGNGSSSSSHNSDSSRESRRRRRKKRKQEEKEEKDGVAELTRAERESVKKSDRGLFDFFRSTLWRRARGGGPEAVVVLSAGLRGFLVGSPLAVGYESSTRHGRENEFPHRRRR